MVEKIKSAGTNVVLCQKGIADVVQHFMNKEGILAMRRIKESDMSKLSKATGGRIVGSVNDLEKTDLGSADIVEERQIEEDKWVFVEGCKNAKAVSLLIRGGSQRVIDEVERSIHDALMVIKDVIEKPMILVGAGAPEAYIANKLRTWSKTLSGREQLAVEKYAEALEQIPLALARNAGMNPIDTITELRAKHSSGEKYAGINVFEGTITNMEKSDVLEPLKVKEQVLKSATETANMILRIDNIVASSRGTTPPPGGSMGGMPEMG